MNIETPKISTWDVLSQKIKQIIPTINLVKSKVRDMFSDQKPNAELELLNIKISEIKTKLNNAKMNMDYKGVLEAEVELEKLNKKKQELEKGNKGNFFSSFFSSLKKATPSMNNISGMTIKIKNTIKQWSGGMKQGLGHVLKYAGALFGLRTIYTTLSNCASSWLSSQNAQAQQLSANIDYMKYAMGSVFAPVIEYVTNLVYSLMKAVQSLVYAFSGVNIFAKATASSMNSASGSASKASKSLSGIHNEINNVSDNDSSGGSGSTSPSIDLSQIDNTSNSIIDAIKNGNWYEVGATIGEKLNDAMSSIPWEKIKETSRNIGTGIAQTLNGFIATTNWTDVGNTFAQGLNTVIEFGHSFLTTFDFKEFGKSIIDGINSFFKNTDWSTLAQTHSESLKGIFNFGTGFVSNIDWEAIIDAIISYIKGIDYSGISTALFELLGSACASLVNLGMTIGEKINEAIDSAKTYFQSKIEECGGNVVEGILTGIGDALANIGQWINEHIFQPFIDGFKEAFGIHSPSTVMAEMGGYLIDGLKQGLSDLWNRIKSPFEEFGKNVSNKFNEIKGKITDWTNNTKATISKWGNNIKAKISETWVNASNTVKEKVTSLKNNISIGLSNTKITISNWGNNVKNSFTKLGENASTWGKDLVSNMANGIKNNISKVTNAVSSVANKIKNFLHFTEPDEGPLSNFHTYMPDMIDLMVSGIKSNANKVKDEIENLAETMSYTINTEAITKINPVVSSGNIADIRPQNVLSNFEDVLSDFNSNNGQPLHITIQYLGKEIFDDTIDYINSKTRRTGKNTIVMVGD